MYNHNLEIVQTFGQENSLLPFYFSSDIHSFLVSNQYFIINELLSFEGGYIYEYQHSITIINRSNGLVESSFKILDACGQIQLYLDTFLITFNEDNCLLQCYNFKGDLLHETTLDEKLEGTNIKVINKELFFVLDCDIICIC
jgi:hypothetical protein